MYRVDALSVIPLGTHVECIKDIKLLLEQWVTHAVWYCYLEYYSCPSAACAFSVS